MNQRRQRPAACEHEPGASKSIHHSATFPTPAEQRSPALPRPGFRQPLRRTGEQQESGKEQGTKTGLSFRKNSRRCLDAAHGETATPVEIGQRIRQVHSDTQPRGIGMFGNIRRRCPCVTADTDVAQVSRHLVAVARSRTESNRWNGCTEEAGGALRGILKCIAALPGFRTAINSAPRPEPSAEERPQAANEEQRTAESAGLAAANPGLRHSGPKLFLQHKNNAILHTAEAQAGISFCRASEPPPGSNGIRFRRLPESGISLRKPEISLRKSKISLRNRLPPKNLSHFAALAGRRPRESV